MAIQTEWQSTSQYITSEIFKIVGTVVSGKTEWHFQEILYTSSKPPPLSWKQTTKTSGPSIVRVTADPPEGPYSIVLKVNGARGCDINLSYKEAEE